MSNGLRLSEPSRTLCALYPPKPVQKLTMTIDEDPLARQCAVHAKLVIGRVPRRGPVVLRGLVDVAAGQKRDQSL